MERDRWQPSEGEVKHSDRLTISQRMARLVINFMETITPADLGDVDEEDLA